MDKKIKLGCVGLRRGRGLISTLLGEENVQIRAICDRDTERLDSCFDWLTQQNKAENLLKFNTFDDLLTSDIDTVIIATEAAAHTKMSIQALNAGKHVLSEIPTINSLEEAEAIRAAVKSNPKLKYMAGENCCFWAFINTWKSMYENGLLGDIWYAESEYLHNVVDLMRDKNGNPTWRAEYDAIKYLTHNLGPLLYIMDDECISASGFAPSINPISEYSTGTPNEIAIFKTKKGALIKIFISLGVERICAHNFSLYGSRGTLETERGKELNSQHTFANLRDIPNTKEMIEIPVDMGYPGANDLGHGGADEKMMKAFINSIINDEKPPVDVELGIKMSIPGIYAHMSMLQGSIPLDIPNTK